MPNNATRGAMRQKIYPMMGILARQRDKLCRAEAEVDELCLTLLSLPEKESQYHKIV